MKRQFASHTNMHTVVSNSIGKVAHMLTILYLDMVNHSFMRKVCGSNKYDKLRWGYLGRDDFIIGPNDTGIIDHPVHSDAQRQIALASMTIGKFKTIQSYLTVLFVIDHNSE